MDLAPTIREALDTVAALRAMAAAQPEIGAAVRAVKRLQAARFRRCYADLLDSRDFGPAARFFLEELYGEADYAQRDQQFARIVGTLSTVFPASVTTTAVALSQLHARTEELDHLMASYCVQHALSPANLDAESYITAWRSVSSKIDRQQQLADVLDLGRELSVLTTKPGLALLLKLMRRPAASAGLGSLQQFLERGFSIFAILSRSKSKAHEFLSSIETRESVWINGMFDNPVDKEAVTLASLIN